MKQVFHSEELQRQMHAEERKFLSDMDPDLQHRQAMAVRSAMNGDYHALYAIRASRNLSPELPDGVATFRPTPNICIFSPMEPTAPKRPLLLYRTVEDGASAA